MRIETLTATLDVPHSQAFRFFADVENLPVWATEFCQSLDKVDGRYYVESPEGRLLFEIEADEATGVVDMSSGPDEDHLMRFPCRVVALPGERSAFFFSLLQAPGVDDEQFEAQLGGLRRELAAVPELVG